MFTARAGLIRQRAQQLEQVRHGCVGGNRDLGHAVQHHALHQRLELRRRDRLPIDVEDVAHDARRHAAFLQHADQDPELPLLILLLGGIPEQVDGARQMRGEDDRVDHER